jgi:hypothetical protein
MTRAVRELQIPAIFVEHEQACERLTEAGIPLGNQFLPASMLVQDLAFICLPIRLCNVTWSVGTGRFRNPTI